MSRYIDLKCFSSEQCDTHIVASLESKVRAKEFIDTHYLKPNDIASITTERHEQDGSPRVTTTVWYWR